MTKIAKAIAQAVDQAEGGVQAMLDDAAMAVMSLNGGSAVPLWNTWLDGLQMDAPAGGEIDTVQLQAIFAKALEELSDRVVRGQGGGQDHDGRTDPRQPGHRRLHRRG